MPLSFQKFEPINRKVMWEARESNSQQTRIKGIVQSENMLMQKTLRFVLTGERDASHDPSFSYNPGKHRIFKRLWLENGRIFSASFFCRRFSAPAFNARKESFVFWCSPWIPAAKHETFSSRSASELVAWGARQKHGNHTSLIDQRFPDFHSSEASARELCQEHYCACSNTIDNTGLSSAGAYDDRAIATDSEKCGAVAKSSLVWRRVIDCFIRQFTALVSNFHLVFANKKSCTWKKIMTGVTAQANK